MWLIWLFLLLGINFPCNRRLEPSRQITVGKLASFLDAFDGPTTSTSSCVSTSVRLSLHLFPNQEAKPRSLASIRHPTGNSSRKVFAEQSNFCHRERARWSFIQSWSAIQQHLHAQRVSLQGEHTFSQHYQEKLLINSFRFSQSTNIKVEPSRGNGTPIWTATPWTFTLPSLRWMQSWNRCFLVWASC